MSFNTDVGVKFWVHKADGTNVTFIDLSLESLNFEFTAIIDGMTVKPNLLNATLKDIKVIDSAIGDIEFYLLQLLIQAGLKVMKQPFN